MAWIIFMNTTIPFLFRTHPYVGPIADVSRHLYANDIATNAAELHNLGFLNLCFFLSSNAFFVAFISHLPWHTRSHELGKCICFFLCCFCSACYSIYFALDTFLVCRRHTSRSSCFSSNINTDRHKFIAVSHPVVGWCTALNSAQQCVGTLNG